MKAARRWPLRVPPVEGEATDSWIDALARRHRVSTSILLTETGIHPVAARRLQMRPNDIEAIAFAAGLGAAEVDALRPITQPPETASSAQGRARLTRRTWSRFCPACLQDTDGRWSLNWRRPYAFACPRHDLLLVSHCPGCGLPARSRRSLRAVPDGRFCGNRYRSHDRSGQAALDTCDVDLRLVGQAAGDGALSEAQVELHRLVSCPAHESVQGVAGATVSVEQLWADIEILTIRQLRSNRSTTATDEPQRWQLRAVDPLTRVRLITRSTPTQLGRAVLHVHRARQGTTADDTLSALLPLIKMGPLLRQKSDGRIEWTPTLRGASQALSRGLLVAAAPRMAAVERLRYGLGTLRPYEPSDIDTCPPLIERARSVPTHIWPSWRSTLAPSSRGDDTKAAAALSRALCLVGRRGTPAEAARTVAAPGRPDRLSLPSWLGRRFDPNLQSALVLLARYLDEGAAPIDYTRRRETFHRGKLIGATDWRAIRSRTRTNYPDDSLAVANHYLRELITGTHAETRLRSQQERGRYQQFRRRLPPAVAHELHAHAASVLEGRGIEEPVIWEPPLGLVKPLSIPRTTIDADRNRASCVAPCGEPVATTKAARWEKTTRLQDRIDAVAIRRAYTEDRLSLSAIATANRCSRNTVSRILRDQTGLALRDKTRRWLIDDAWFRDRYFTDLMTVKQVAAEIGCSPGTVGRFARENGIELRRRGSRSQLTGARQRATFDGPALLRRVLTDEHSLQRLERFRSIAEATTLTAAAEMTGISQGTMVTQLQRLERDLGTRLVIRAKRGQPMRLTRTGRQLAGAIDAHLVPR